MISATKRKNTNVRKNGLDELKRLFPEVFKNKRPAPLKKGIDKDIVEKTGMGKHKVDRALRYYTNWPQYLKSFKEGVKRIDLDGNVTDEIISKEEVSFAKAKIKANRKRLNKSRPPKK